MTDNLTNEAAERLREHLDQVVQDDHSLSLLDAALSEERRLTVERAEPYMAHRGDCAYIQPVDESAWRSVVCTCSPEKWWGDHDAGCPRATAFRVFMDRLEVPDCNCGLAAILDEIGGAR